jgi:DNA-binding LacI/PurR family transcriptional regulator
VAWIDVDNEGLMRQGVRHLLDYGHRRIALLSMATSNVAVPGIQSLPSSDGLFDGIERERYFKLLMEEYGPSTCSGEIVLASGKDWNIYPGTVQFLREQEFTAVICGDYVALKLMEQAERAGLAIPRDLSIVGIDNQRSAAERGLTSMAFGYDEVGKLAVEAWIELKQGKDAADCCKVAPVQLISRQSVGRPHCS